MLNIYLGELENAIYDTSTYFKFSYEPQWFEDDMVKKMVLDVDQSKVLSGAAIESPFLGVIPPTSLSGGVKTLILIYKEKEKIFNASNCGDNCSKWLLEMAKDADFTINLRHIMDFKNSEFEIKILNTNQIVTNMQDFVDIAGRYV